MEESLKVTHLALPIVCTSESQFASRAKQSAHVHPTSVSHFVIVKPRQGDENENDMSSLNTPCQSRARLDARIALQ